MLLKLPPELRESIYKFVLLSQKPLVTFHIDEYQREAYQEAVQPPLLYVSRQIRQEAVSLFYSVNNFILFTEGKKLEEAQSWLRNSEQFLPHIEGVSLWVRYFDRTRSHIASSGAFAVTMRLVPRETRWMVLPCSWISPVRKPADYDTDSEFLVKELQRLTRDANLSIDGFITLIHTLRNSYGQFKHAVA